MVNNQDDKLHSYKKYEKLLRNDAEYIAKNHWNIAYIEVSKKQVIIKSKYNVKVKCKADM